MEKSEKNMYIIKLLSCTPETMQNYKSIVFKLKIFKGSAGE